MNFKWLNLGRMKKFKVLLNGQNFLVWTDGHLRAVEFFATRYVEALDANEAELRAVDMLRDDPELIELTQNDPNDPPMIYLESIQEVEEMCTVSGYTFYSSEEDSSVPE
ncbi:MAG TPA: hypothetical protein VGK19_25445 [Capsulimonadaceae bacterium]|jgi:hypothetical protein